MEPSHTDNQTRTALMVRMKPPPLIVANGIRVTALLAAICLGGAGFYPVLHGRSPLSPFGHTWAGQGLSFGLTVFTLVCLITSLLSFASKKPLAALISLYAALPFICGVGVIELHHLGFL